MCTILVHIWKKWRWVDDLMFHWVGPKLHVNNYSKLVFWCPLGTMDEKSHLGHPIILRVRSSVNTWVEFNTQTYTNGCEARGHPHPRLWLPSQEAASPLPSIQANFALLGSSFPPITCNGCIHDCTNLLRHPQNLMDDLVILYLKNLVHLIICDKCFMYILHLVVANYYTTYITKTFMVFLHMR